MYIEMLLFLCYHICIYISMHISKKGFRPYGKACHIS